MARFEARGAAQQEERSAALQHGLNPDEPAHKPADPVQEALREANEKPVQAPAPEPTMPGDPVQQARVFSRVYPDEHLWPLPRIQDGLRAVAEETEARERATLKPGQTAYRTVANQMAYWEPRFYDSVYYILYRRDGAGLRGVLISQLRAQEELLMQASPGKAPRNTPETFREMGRATELVAKVEALRQTYREKWRQTVDHTADRFITLASHQARFLTVGQAAAPISVFGLPERFEGTVERSAHPDIVAEKSTPVAPSVIKFWTAVQKESGLKAQVGNYTDHEKHSPHFGNKQEVGKYSFDVHLGFKLTAEGFYERQPMIDFFLAVDKASAATGIGWIALYNDFEVAKKVNETLGKQRILFSGLGSTEADPGSIHHGPSPYLLHVHFNIMPIDLAMQFITGKDEPRLKHIDTGMR